MKWTFLKYTMFLLWLHMTIGNKKGRVKGLFNVFTFISTCMSGRVIFGRNCACWEDFCNAYVIVEIGHHRIGVKSSQYFRLKKGFLTNYCWWVYNLGGSTISLHPWYLYWTIKYMCFNLFIRLGKLVVTKENMIQLFISYKRIRCWWGSPSSLSSLLGKMCNT